MVKVNGHTHCPPKTDSARDRGMQIWACTWRWELWRPQLPLLSLGLSRICSLRVTGTSSSPSPKPCPVSKVAASPISPAQDCCSSWPGKEAQDNSFAGRSAAAPLRGAQTPLLYHTSSVFVLCLCWVVPQLMRHLYRTDWWLFPLPHTLCRGKGLATGCDRHAKGQGERHRQHQENSSKTLLHMGKHSSSCLAFGVIWLWSCCNPGFNARQAQTHQSWWTGRKQWG